jgi:hypothetical protein
MLLATAVAPVAAWPPVELEVAPALQVIAGCPTATANWTVYLYGGASGLFTVTVHYGEGHIRTRYLPAGAIAWSYAYNVSANCGIPPWPQYDLDQSWSASRSGGGVDYDSSHVAIN